jgi:hypothetical protein
MIDPTTFDFDILDISMTNLPANEAKKTSNSMLYGVLIVLAALGCGVYLYNNLNKEDFHRN